LHYSAARQFARLANRHPCGIGVPIGPIEALHLNTPNFIALQQF